jgi:hypothetical protein
MKRILIVITLIATYSVALASTSAKVNTVKKSEVTVVADDNHGTVISNRLHRGTKEKLCSIGQNLW